MVTRKKQVHLVKINRSGRFSIMLSRSLKPVFLDMVQKSASRRTKLFELKMRQALLSEIYTKHFAMLHLDRETAMLVSPAQAYALWFAYGYDYINENPELANLMMQLHQKLS